MTQTVPTTSQSNRGHQDTSTWGLALNLSCELSVGLKVATFQVRELLRLGVGTVVDSGWKAGANVPVSVNGVLVAWGELDVVANHLAARLTDIAQDSQEG